MEIPYQKQLDKILLRTAEQPKKPILLLHACCAPCSSYVLQYLHRYFQIRLFYYNPNISSAVEYQKRITELYRLLNEMGLQNEIALIEGAYHPQVFFEAIRGLENEPEGGARCEVCFRLRLDATAQKAREIGAQYFCTTLSISPHKNAALLNHIGNALAEKYGVCWLPSDFKKKGGYQTSILLSRQYRLYRQNYCGCVFSKREETPKGQNRIPPDPHSAHCFSDTI